MRQKYLVLLIIYFEREFCHFKHNGYIQKIVKYMGKVLSRLFRLMLKICWNAKLTKKKKKLSKQKQTKLTYLYVLNTNS